MTETTPQPKLSPKMRYSLLAFAHAETLTTYDVAARAIKDGTNRTSLRFEWADAPMRELRRAGLLEYTSQTNGLGRRYHRLTEAGQKALAAELQAQEAGDG